MTDVYTPPQSDLNDRNSKQGAVTVEMVDALRGTKGWVLLVGILMYIGAAFMVIAAIGMILGGAAMGGTAKGMPAGMFAGMGVAYLLIALLYIFPATYLIKYSSAIGRLISDGQPANMEAALHQQRKFWKFVGVLSLIGVAVMVVGMVAAISVPMWMATHS